ncbi:matrixin family metalloprotease [Lacibacter luteus]|uniref:Matrixin family metalloprotease n=1 Tax=Lacibacter luteus TaxID=2508719 RepID=A0A4Q1CJJ3_9BACT|nr:matrixin family metalloprotease [Lacibacter luteus]RXK60780.1 matrixin family metalloprotease [Lacibacter luteus]
MKSPRKATFAILLSFLFSNSLFAQCMMVPVSLNQRVSQSNYIVKGVVAEKETFADPATGNIYTLNKIAVKAWLKNKQQSAFIYIRTEGGVHKGRATLVYPSLQLQEKQAYVLFLNKVSSRNENAAVRNRNKAIIQTTPYAGAQAAIVETFGLFTDVMQQEKQTEEELFLKIKNVAQEEAVTPEGKRYEPAGKPRVAARTTAVSSVSPSAVRAGTTDAADQITITGTGFGTTVGNVFFANANDGGATFIASGLNSDIISWNDNTIVAKVPSEAGTGPVVVDAVHVSPSNLTVQYAHTSIEHTFYGYAETTRQRYYLRNLNGSGGYTFQLNTSFAANTSAATAFSNAVVTWRNNTAVNFSVTGTTSVATSADDNVNAVYFNPAIAAGTLAICTSNFRASAVPGVCEQSNTIWWLSDMDIQFRDVPTASTTWQYGPAAPASNQYDFQSVALHELGHAHGLGHVIASGQVMHYAIANGATARTLSANDIAAGIAKLSYSDDPTCFNPSGSGAQMTPATGGTLPVSFLSFRAKRNDKTRVTVNWSTALEYNNKGFFVERGETTQQMKSIAFVNSKEQSALQHNYSYIDEKAGPFAWYYRITQQDFSGNSISSTIVYVNGDETNSWRVWTSEAGDQLQVYLQNWQDKKVSLQLFSSTGQLIINTNITGSRTILPVQHLQKGYYSYRLTDGAEVISGKLMLGH